MFPAVTHAVVAHRTAREYNSVEDFEIRCDRKLQLMIDVLSTNYTAQRDWSSATTNLPYEILYEIARLVSTYNLASSQTRPSHHLFKFRMLGKSYAAAGLDVLVQEFEIQPSLPSSLKDLINWQSASENPKLSAKVKALDLHLLIRDAHQYPKRHFSLKAAEPRVAYRELPRGHWIKRIWDRHRIASPKDMELELSTFLLEQQDQKIALLPTGIPGTIPFSTLVSRLLNLEKLHVTISHINYGWANWIHDVSNGTFHGGNLYASRINYPLWHGDSHENLKVLLGTLSEAKIFLKSIYLDGVPFNFLAGTSIDKMKAWTVLSGVEDLTLSLSQLGRFNREEERHWETSVETARCTSLGHLCAQMKDLARLRINGYGKLISFDHQYVSIFRNTFAYLREVKLLKIVMTMFLNGGDAFIEFLARHVSALRVLWLEAIVIDARRSDSRQRTLQNQERWTRLLRTLREKHLIRPLESIRLRQPVRSFPPSWPPKYINEWIDEPCQELALILEQFGRECINDVNDARNVNDNDERCGHLLPETVWLDISDYVTQESAAPHGVSGEGNVAEVE